MIKKVGTPEQGTWVHPEIATPPAIWCSVKFAVQDGVALACSHSREHLTDLQKLAACFRAGARQDTLQLGYPKRRLESFFGSTYATYEFAEALPMDFR